MTFLAHQLEEQVQVSDEIVINVAGILRHHGDALSQVNVTTCRSAASGVRGFLYFDPPAARRVQPLVRPHPGPYDSRMALQLTAVFQKVPEGYIGFVEELPGANTQGATLEEARENLQEAIAMVLEANRELIEATSRGAEVIREPIKVGA